MAKSKYRLLTFQELMDAGLRDALVNALNKSCLTIVRSARKACPKDDGQLRRSITFQVDAEEIEAVVYTECEYSEFVHEGSGLYARQGNGRKQVPWTYRTADGKFHKTSGMEAHPFLEIAVNNSAGRIRGFFRNII